MTTVRCTCPKGCNAPWQSPGECPMHGHRPIEGSDFMFPEWCGACDACGPAPTVCAFCSYDAEGGPDKPVDWPCAHATAGHHNGAENTPPTSTTNRRTP